MAETKINEEHGTIPPLDDCCDNTATTTFVDDGSVVVADYSKKIENDTLKIEMQSICDFLAKPYVLSSFDWSTSNLSNSVIYSIAIGKLLNSGVTIANPLQIPYWYDKIKGFGLIRGTFVIRVTLNANPFQAGALLGHFLPLESTITPLDPSYVKMHNLNLTTKTQQPNFFMTCEDSSAVMEIPYVSPTNWYAFTDGPVGNSTKRFDWGTFYLSVLSQLAVGSGQDTTVPISVYGYWRDVELAAPLVPQSRNPAAKYKAKTVKRSGPSLSDKEAKPGPISQGLKGASMLSGALSTIPPLYPVMSGVSWAMDMAAGVASSFGWAKPRADFSNNIMTNQYNRYMATSDGFSVSNPLGLISKNEIILKDDLSVYDKDEMSFNFLKKVSSLIQTINWTTSAITNDSLYVLRARPELISTTGSTTVVSSTLNYRTGPPIFYLSRGFAMWRGSFKMSLHFIKTQFHTGRLQVTWTPNTVSNVGADVYNSLYSLREIIDLRDGNIFEFNLPYMAEYDYLDQDTQSGVLEIRVLNELRAPTTVLNSIDILVFFSGGDDFELQAPVNTKPSISKRMVAFNPQSKTFVVDEGVGGSPIQPLTTTFSERSVGESFNSTKQLLNRATGINQGALYTNGVTVYPWFSTVGYNSATGLAGPNEGGDAFCYISQMYALMRGGVDIHYYNSTATGGINPVFSTLGSRTSSTTSVVAYLTSMGTLANANSFWGANSGSTLAGTNISPRGDGIVSVSVPYYNKTKCSLRLNNVLSSDVIADYPSQPVPVVIITNTSTGTTRLLRSVKDDFQFHYFVGCPPVFDS